MSTTPVPSLLPEDLRLNAQGLDRLVAGTDETFTDRLGNVKLTAAGIAARAQAQVDEIAEDVSAARDEAVAAAEDAQDAADGVAAVAEMAGYFDTLTAANAALAASLVPLNHAVTVNADGSNNGTWVNVAGTLVKKSSRILSAMATSTELQSVIGPNYPGPTEMFETQASPENMEYQVLAVMGPDNKPTGGIRGSEAYPAVFETQAKRPRQMMVDSDNRVILLGAKGDELSLEVFESQSEAVGSGAILDADGRVLSPGAAAAAQQDQVIAEEVADARGTRTTLSQRIGQALTEYGDPVGQYLNKSAMRQTRRLLQLIDQGYAGQYDLVLIGDSFTHNPFRYSRPLAQRLQSRHGFAGLGWIGFAWFGSDVATWNSGFQPTGKDGTARSDLLTVHQIIGDWIRVYNSPSAGTPSLSYATSSTSGDYHRFTVPAAGAAGSGTCSISGTTLTLLSGSVSAGQVITGSGITPGTIVTGPATLAGTYTVSNSHSPTGSVAFTSAYTNAMRLFYAGDGTGVVAVSWDDGATYGADIPLTTSGPANVALSGCPAAGCIARIKVVSGNVSLAGVDHRSSAPGVRVHKLGGSGSRASQWATVDAEAWGEQIAALGGNAHLVMLATNDQSVGTAPSTLAGYLATILSNVGGALPKSDRCIVMPPENLRTAPDYAPVIAYPMTEYAAAARVVAASSGYAYCDLQDSFGPDPADYAELFNPDKVHPEPSTGGPAMTAGIYPLFDI